MTLKRIVGPDGPLHCRIALVGEAPGSDEEHAGKPFIGTSGRLLMNCLHSIGVVRHECYITNVVKYRPAGNEFGVFWSGTQPKAELIEARDALLQELCYLDTNVIVALGSNALWALTGFKYITKYRGSIIPVTLPNGRIIKVIPTYHPAFALRDFPLIFTINLDLRKAIHESTFPECNLPVRNTLINPTLSDVIEWCSKPGDVSFDIETSPGRINCIGLAYDKDNAICIPTTIKYWGSFSIVRQVWEHVAKVLEDPTRLKIAQNITYEYQYISRLVGINIARPWFDTMLAHHACYPEMPKGLDYLASVYTNEPYYKDDLKIWLKDTTADETLWIYNGKDCTVTYECKDALVREMQRCGSRQTFDFRMELLNPILYMMIKGVKVDLKAIRDHQCSYTEKIAWLEHDFERKFGAVNARSSKQMIELIESMGIDAPMKKGKKSADKKSLEKLAIKNSDLAIAADIRSEKTIVSNYLNMETDIVDGRLRCSFNVAGTETGRLSSGESVWLTGRNLQNLPKKVRNIIHADEGKTLIAADLSGAESRVVAYESEDPIGIRVFESGDNIHTITAGQVFGLNPAQVAADKEACKRAGRDTESKYFISKKLRHSVEKLGTWVTISEQLRIPAAEAKKLIQRFYDANPNLVRWALAAEAQLFRNRTITTPFGDKRIFFGRPGKSAMNSNGWAWAERTKLAIAHIAQDTVGRTINTGILNVYNTLCKDYPDLDLLLQVHDEVVLQCWDCNVKELLPKLTKALEVKIPKKDGTYYIIPTEIKTGKNWRDMKDV